MSRILLAMLFGILTTACLPIGDTAFKIKGRFVDRDRNPYEACTLTVKHDGRVIEESAVSGDFRETIVFAPTSRDPVIVSGSCLGATSQFQRQIDRIPDDLEEFVDLGEIVLN